MREFIKRIPGQIISTYAIMIAVFFVISFCRGVESIPTIRLGQLALLAVLGGVLMELYFGKCIIKNMSDISRCTLYVITFAGITFACAVAFQWITHLDSIKTYAYFISIFAICWIVAIFFGELEHYFRGRKYTDKLKEYQERRNHAQH